MVVGRLQLTMRTGGRSALIRLYNEVLVCSFGHY